MFSLICVWINGWVNIREAGDLRRHRGHYDVNVMKIEIRYQIPSALPRSKLAEETIGLNVYSVIMPSQC